MGRRQSCNGHKNSLLDIRNNKCKSPAWKLLGWPEKYLGGQVQGEQGGSYDVSWSYNNKYKLDCGISL